MGADTFHTTNPSPDVNDAFQHAVEEAGWEYGHRGYTGTIAEKSSYVVFDLPAGKTVDDVVRLLSRTCSPGDEYLPAGIREVYDDKWGPAVAMRDEAGLWHFFGWASC